VIWNDGAGVSHAVSTDRGRRWSERARINPVGGSSHLAIGPHGEIAVRITPLSAFGSRFDAGVELIAVSADGGDSWRRSTPPGERAWFPFRDTTVTPPRWGFPAQPRWVEPLAWDSTGTLYSFWVSGADLWLARSADLGSTWNTWKIGESDATPYYPYLIARGRGDLAASWFSGKGDSLRAHVARIRVSPDTAGPAIVVAEPFRIESWVLPGLGDSTARDPAGEYLPVIFTTDGSLGLVAPLQNAPAGRFGFSWRRYTTRERREVP
jgi:hypothetical protein